MARQRCPCGAKDCTGRPTKACKAYKAYTDGRCVTCYHSRRCHEVAAEAERAAGSRSHA